MEKIRIRQAGIEDLGRIREVTRQAYRIPIKKNGFVTKATEPKDLRRQVAERRIGILTAELDGRIVGALRYRTEGRYLFIFRLAVLKTFRQHGAAGELLRGAERIAARAGYAGLKLDCLLEKGLPDYYKKKGFKVDRVEDCKVFHEVYMSKKLR